jgi:DNA-binding NarL/FixJ family response regulator
MCAREKPVDRIAVQLHARHPVAAVQYARLLSAHRDIRVVSGDETALIGILDGEPAWIEEALRALLERFPALRPLVLSPSGREEQCRHWIRIRAWGLVTYDHYKEELLPAIRHVAEGRLWFPAPVVLDWVRDPPALSTSTPQLRLTPRELEVMGFLREGRLSNKEIAVSLRISERTVKFHVGNILSKLHVGSRQALTGYRVVASSGA